MEAGRVEGDRVLVELVVVGVLEQRLQQACVSPGMTYLQLFRLHCNQVRLEAYIFITR